MAKSISIDDLIEKKITPSLWLVLPIFITTIIVSILLLGYRFDLNPIILDTFKSVIYDDTIYNLLISTKEDKAFYLETLPSYFFGGKLSMYVWFYLVYKILYLKNITYLFRKNSLIMKSGIFSKQEDSIEYSKIFDFETDRPLFLRFFSLSNIFLIVNDYSSDNLNTSKNQWWFTIGDIKTVKQRLLRASTEQEGVSLDLKLLLGLKREESLLLKDFILESKESSKHVLTSQSKQYL